jgi:hypothetical protein
VRTQRRAADPGTSGSSSSPSECSIAIVGRDGTAPSSAKETWMPRPASSEATSDISLLGTRTITPTSGWLVFRCESGCTCRILVARALTSSVDITHVPTPSNSKSCVLSATARSRQGGIG